MAVEITFPSPPPELAPNARVHWKAKSAVTRAYRQTAWLLGREAISKTLTKGGDCWWPLKVPVTSHITFAFNVTRKRDEDNLLASLKALFDGLVDAHVLAADDSKSLHHAPITVVVDKTLKAPEVRVRLEASDD